MSRLRSQDGMTLPEVLIAITTGFVLLAATLGLLDSTLRLSNGVMAKTDAMQRGRLAMDRITQQLRSQVCLNLTTPAVLPGATDDSVTFYSDFGNGNQAVAPSKRTLSFDPATGHISDSVIAPTGTPPGPITYTLAPRKNLIFENAARQTKQVGAATQVVPFLTYYAFETTGNPARLDTTLRLTTPLDAASAARVARIDIAFMARPTGATDSKNGTNVEDRISVRHADPNLTVPDPMCV